MVNEIKTTINQDLAKERNNCSFNIEELASFWFGGTKKLLAKRKREKFFLEDPDFYDDVPAVYRSHKEIYENTVRKATIVFKKIQEIQQLGEDDVENYMALLGGLLGSGLIPEGNPMAVHYVMFIPSLLGQGTPEQQGDWIGRAWMGQIIGTYAQTELGHGTFIRGLETISTYDPKTEEFILNSPTITSYKWWPGGLGHTANYAVVVAQLFSQGKCHGIFPFICQLRDEETHMPMPGIIIGEIGQKLGMNGTNNGFLGFKNVRIPRKNMLMKNAQILKDGSFIKSPSSVLTYGTMMFVRVVIVRDMSNYLTKAVTIATRYSCVRRQSPINPDQPEVQVIDHVTQQNKIFPALAKSIVFKVVADDLWDKYNNVTSELERGNLERLPELHALSCCLKSVCTSDAAAGVEICRLACGGHGYLSSSNFPLTYGLVTAACTYEGENTVLLLQTARFLIKAWNSALLGEKLTPTVSYLEYAIKYNNTINEWDSSLIGINASLKTVAAGKLRLAYEHIEQRKKQGLTHEEACNLTSIELAATAEAHCRAFLCQSAYEMIEKSILNYSRALGNVLRNIVELYIVDTCLKTLGDLLRFTKIRETDITQLQIRLENVLAKIRPDAVGIVDGFDIPDRVINSTLGSYDGNVYERLMEAAKKSPLNQEPVNKSFHMYLKPMMKSQL